MADPLAAAGPWPRARYALTGGLLLVLFLIGWAPLSGSAGLLRWIGILLLGGLLHLGLAGPAWRWRGRLTPADFALVFGMAALFRLALLPLAPVLSDDVYRHLWDGRVQAAGADVYRFAPDAPELAGLRDAAFWPKINHPAIPTIYPPTTQRAARAAALAGDFHPLAAWKALLVAGELAGLLLLALALNRTGRAAAIVIVAWSPLAVVEGAGSGHVDALGLGLLAAALAAMLRSRPLAAGFAFTLSALVKFISLPAAFLLAAAGSRRRVVAGALLAGAVVMLPYGGQLAGLRTAVARYSGDWEFNGVLHRALGVDGWWPRARQAVTGAVEATAGPADKRRGRALLSLAVGAGGLALLRRGALPAVGVATWTLGLALLVQPTLHPWYALWLLPLLAVHPVRGFLLWTALLPLTYEVLLTRAATGAWRENTTAQALIVVAVLMQFGVTTLSLSRARRGRGGITLLPDGEKGRDEGRPGKGLISYCSGMIGGAAVRWRTGVTTRWRRYRRAEAG